MANSQTFTPSGKVKEYQKKQEEYEKAYQTALERLSSSSLGVGVQDALNRIVNRTPFTYDLNADGLYQQYKQQYQRQGSLAMEDTLSKAANLTGGYGNSYGVQAGMQAYQSHLDKLNDVIPQLYSLAYTRYQNQTKQLQREYEALLNLDKEQYGRQKEAAADALAMAKYYGNLGQDTLEWESDLWQQALKRADSLAQQEYEKQRDAVADAQWQKEYALAVQKAANSSSSSSKTQSITQNVEELKDASKWGAGEWEAYFVNQRNRYGYQKALDTLQYMARNGIIPTNMISFGLLGVKGYAKGH